jgi:hypothetical protein
MNKHVNTLVICVLCAVMAITDHSLTDCQSMDIILFWTRLTRAVKCLLCTRAVYAVESAVYETPVFSK